MDIVYFILFVVIIILVFKKLYCKEIPCVIYKHTPRNENFIGSIKFLQQPYEYILWGTSFHMQTMFSTAIRLFWPVEYIRELLDTPDGGVIALDYLEIPQKNDSVPIILIVPGICSTSKANYVKCFSTLCKRNGYKPVVFIPRGCDIIKTPKIFTLGDTTDLRQVIHYLHDTYPCAPIIAVGFSLGANVLVKYIGEVTRNNEEKILKGGISLSQGYDAESGIDYIRTVPFYEQGLAFRLTSLVKKHSKLFENMVDIPLVTSVKSVEEFDRHFTCKLHGYENPKAYYRKHSCASYVKEASVTLFLVNAMDDPLVKKDNIPFNAPLENENLYLITTKYGGHLGWCEGFIYPNLIHWHDKLALALVSAIIQHDKL